MPQITSDINRISEKIQHYIEKLCYEISNRHVGSPGNRDATLFFAETIDKFGFTTESSGFDCIEWEYGKVRLLAGGEFFDAHASPYSLPCRLNAPLLVATTLEELEKIEVAGKILLIHGELAKEQLVPKKFPFYIPVTYPGLVELLEQKQPAAIIAATGRNPELAGALYPFPLIEDGDFDIPSVYMTDVEGARLVTHCGTSVSLDFQSQRIPARGYNVVARKGGGSAGKLVFCAHIDAKKGTPGALDNATGIATLLALAELLADYSGSLGVEIVALNGEDYFSAPGQQLYLELNEPAIEQIKLAINLDGAGFRGQSTVFSLFDCPEKVAELLRQVLGKRSGILEGEPWYQSDHMIFVSRQRPAVAITSGNFIELSSEIAHTEKDIPELADCEKLAELASGLRDFVKEFELY